MTLDEIPSYKFKEYNSKLFDRKCVIFIFFSACIDGRVVQVICMCVNLLKPNTHNQTRFKVSQSKHSCRVSYSASCFPFGVEPCNNPVK